MKKSNSLMKRVLFVVMALAFYAVPWAQTKTITGMVKDATGQSIIGASIVVKGTTLGTVTNVDGYYSLGVPTSAKTIVVSYIGMETQEIALTGSVINITLKDAATDLNELVVVGYGTMKKSDLTGATTSIKAADIANVKSTNALQVLQGKVTGLDVTQGSGEAGSSVSLTLRGRRSITTGNAPLIIVDGVEYGGTLDVNSSDIESMNVLKDAASTAIYGTRGANGVIMVTTKKGSSGKTHVSYNTYFTSNQAQFLPHIMNGAQYAQKQLDIKVADGDVAKWNAMGVSYNSTANTVNLGTNADPNSVWGTTTLDELIQAKGATDKYELITADPEGLQLLRDGVSLDYLSMIMKQTMSQNHELSVYGGDAKTSFNISLGYMLDNGLLVNDNMSRYNLKFGVDHNLTKNFKVGASMILTRKDYNKRNSSVFNQALKAGPIGILRNEDGTYRPTPDLVFAYNQGTPMLDEVPGAASNQITNNRIFTNIYANWDITHDLTFRTSLGLDISNNKNGLFSGANSLAQQTVLKPYSQLEYSDNFAYTFDNTLNYSKKFGEHSLQALLGTSTNYSRQQSMGVNYSGQSSAGTLWYDMNYDSGAISNATYEPYQMVSIFGRVNYSYKDKYLLQGTLRNDNASQLAPGHKSAIFPSASAGWRISEEDFMKNQDVFSNLKLRYSWGSAGNASSVSAYGTLATVSTNVDYATEGSTIYQQYAPSTVANANLTWEKTQTHDLGLDFEILHRRVTGSIDAYLSHSTDLIFNVPLPTNQGGYTQAIKNIASSQNKGIEVSITTYNIQAKNFSWSTDWGISYNENQITALYGKVNSIQHGNMIWQVGSQVNSFFNYQVEGLYSIADMQKELDYVKATQTAGGTIDKVQIPMLANKYFPGDIKIKDVNGDGLYNDLDKVAVNGDPKYIFNFNNTFDLKTDIGNFGLSILTIGRLDQNFNYGFYGSVKTAADKTNGSYVPTWSPTGDNTGVVFPRYYTLGTNVNRSDFMSALSIVNGSFIKVKDITLFYTFPKKTIESLKISNVRVYGTAKNMFTFSNIDNYDPESNGSLNFPTPKQLIVGLNLEF